MYTVCVQAHYDAAHSLPDYDGKCSRLHGHRYVVEAAVQAENLDDSGIAFDFVELKGLLRELADELDHTNLNDLPQFADSSTSAECQARYFHKALEARLPAPLSDGLVYVRIWESPTQWAQYSRREWTPAPGPSGV